MGKLTVDISSLPPEDRLDLIEQLWESLRKDTRGVPLTRTQREELDRRLDEMDEDGGAGIPWDFVLKKIREGR